MKKIAFSEPEIAVYYGIRMPKLQQKGAEWRGPCSVHQGQNNSFVVDSKTGQAFCHSKCQRGWNILTLEQELTGASPEAAYLAVLGLVGRQERQITDRYNYDDENGQLLFQCVRYMPKGFKQRRPNGRGGWAWNLDGVRLVPYRLPRILASEFVVICEGEKDVHAVEGLGHTGSCNPMGAGKWHSDYARFFEGKMICVIPDNDPPGKAHAAQVVKSLLGVARRVQILSLPYGKDVSDWASAGDAESFAHMIASAPEADSAQIAELEAHEQRCKTSLTPGARGASRFIKDDDGIWFVSGEDGGYRRFICSRLDVTAYTRSDEGKDWGRLLRWLDSEGREHIWAMPMSMLSGEGADYRSHLYSGGLIPGVGRAARDHLTTYIATAKPSEFARCVGRIGWYGSVYVFPEQTIGSPGAERVLLQLPGKADHGLHVRGSAEEWRLGVGLYCTGNSRLVFAASCAFGGPLLNLLGAESGGFHFWGESSIGKSTALVVAGSVCGGGKEGYIQSWRTTLNGLEAVAELHNDGLLCLDEISQVDARQAAEGAYLLANGSGKSRMTKASTSQKRSAWRLLFLSNGETTLAEHAASAGIRSRAGTEVRLINIPAQASTEHGLFEQIHGAESGAEFSKYLKRAALSVFGAPIRAFIAVVANDRSRIEEKVRRLTDSFVTEHVPSGASGEVLRAADRFGIVAAAGELATELGLTGWSPGAATDAAALCYRSWLQDRGGTRPGDEQKALAQVASFIELHGASRFQVIRGRPDPSANDRVVNRAGFRTEDEEGNTLYYILPQVFRCEVCAGYDYRMVVKALASKRHLVHLPNRNMSKPRLPELGTTWVYAVAASIVQEGCAAEFDRGEPGTSGDMGTVGATG
jgi:putative DNA primase/helicase